MCWPRPFFGRGVARASANSVSESRFREFCPFSTIAENQSPYYHLSPAPLTSITTTPHAYHHHPSCLSPPPLTPITTTPHTYHHHPSHLSPPPLTPITTTPHTYHHHPSHLSPPPLTPITNPPSHLSPPPLTPITSLPHTYHHHPSHLSPVPPPPHLSLASLTLVNSLLHTYHHHPSHLSPASLKPITSLPHTYRQPSFCFLPILPIILSSSSSSPSPFSPPHLLQIWGRCPTLQGAARWCREVLSVGGQIQLPQPAGGLPPHLLSQSHADNLPQRHGSRCKGTPVLKG